MTNVVGVESRGEAKRDVTLGAALTNDDKFWKIADFRKNFHKGVSDLQFQSFCFFNYYYYYYHYYHYYKRLRVPFISFLEHSQIPTPCVK